MLDLFVSLSFLDFAKALQNTNDVKLILLSLSLGLRGVIDRQLLYFMEFGLLRVHTSCNSKLFCIIIARNE